MSEYFGSDEHIESLSHENLKDLARYLAWSRDELNAIIQMQDYLELVSYGTNADFLALLEECGLQNVMEKAYLDSLYVVLREELLNYWPENASGIL